jgi:hypothetical protein
MGFDANAQAEITRLKAALEVNSPQLLYSRPETVRLIAMLNLAISSGGGGGGGAVASTKITDGGGIAAIALGSVPVAVSDPALAVAIRSDSTIGVSSLPASFVADIASIKANTAKISQFAFQLAEDSAGTVFLIRTDTITGTSASISIATGMAFAPVGAIELTDPISSGLSIEVNEFSALTTSAGNWVLGDILTRVRVIDSATGLVTVTNWQKATGAVLATVPVIGADIEDATKRELALLQSILNSQTTLASAGFQKLTDGVNTVTIRAGGSAPVLGDPGLVVSTRPDSTIGVSSLPASVVADIAAIKVNTARLPQSSHLLAEDSSGVAFLVRVDNTTQITTYINLTTGLSYIPIGAVELTDPLAAQITVQTNEFEAITTSAGNWAIGDILTKLVVTSTAGATVSTIWQSATGTVLGTLPVVGVDVVDRDKQELAVLRSQLTTLGSLLTRLSDAAQKSQITNSVGLAASIAAASAAPVAADPGLVVSTRPDSTIGVSSLPASVVADIASIKANTAKISQFAFQLAEDSGGTVFLIKTDTIAGTSTNINVATGLAFVPVGAIELTDPISSGLLIEVNEFAALTASAGNWAIGDILTRVRVVNSTTGLVSVTNWQKADGTALATVPAIGTDIEDATKRELALLQAILSSQSTIASAGFQKLTDGTNTATIKAGSSSPALADTALVVSLSGNSANMGGLTPNVTATRSSPVSGIFNTALPTLTAGQMVPLQLTANSELVASPYIAGLPIAGNSGAVSAQTQRVVQAQLVATRTGAAVNPTADTALPANSRVRQLLFTNNSATAMFLQIFVTGAAIAANAVPNVLVIRVPANATLDKTVGDFGENGTLYGATVRIGISSTFGTYTAALAGVLALCSLSVETV